MPELSDVEGFRRYRARYATGKPIDKVEVLDRAMARNRRPAELSRELEGKPFGTPRRHGKWLLVDAGSDTCLMHFGMTGLLHWSAARRAPHPHDRILFHLRSGTLSYRDMRRFGGVWLARSDDEAAAVTGPLGPDALSVSRSRFDELLAGRRGALKPALIDQTLVAGLGNLLCDEILWQARINPREPVSGLSTRQRHRLHATMRGVLCEANRHGRVPPLEGWLTRARDERDARCPRCGRRLMRATIGGRTTRWCPHHQRRR